MYGKKRTIVVITAFGLVGDVVAALATDYSPLLVGRIVAGLYAQTAAIAYSMTRDAFPRRTVGTASGILAASVALVVLGGPFLSAWLIDNHGFRGALWFVVVSTLVCLATSVAAGAIISQLVFTVMAQDGTVAHGTQSYLDSGFTNGLWLVAAACAIGALLVLLVPKATRRIDTVDSGQAA